MAFAAHNTPRAASLVAACLGFPFRNDIEVIEDLREFSWCFSTAGAVGVSGPWRASDPCAVFEDNEGYIVVAVIQSITLDDGGLLAGSVYPSDGRKRRAFVLDADRELARQAAKDLVQKAASITREMEEVEPTGGGFDGELLQ